MTCFYPAVFKGFRTGSRINPFQQIFYLLIQVVNEPRQNKNINMADKIIR